MRALSWLLRAVFFLLALGFALSNTRIAELRLLDFVWSAPLVIFLLLCFVAGLSVGLVAVAPTLYRQRREISRLRGASASLTAGSGVASPPPDVPRAPDAASRS